MALTYDDVVAYELFESLRLDTLGLGSASAKVPFMLLTSMTVFKT